MKETHRPSPPARTGARLPPQPAVRPSPAARCFLRGSRRHGGPQGRLCPAPGARRAWKSELTTQRGREGWSSFSGICGR